MDATLRIKNLSIALEALSRVNSWNASDLYQQVADSLKVELARFEKEQDEERPSPARPAIPTPDDDIPF